MDSSKEEEEGIVEDPVRWTVAAAHHYQQTKVDVLGMTANFPAVVTQR
jgi:hypothetical protein